MQNITKSNRAVADSKAPRNLRIKYVLIRFVAQHSLDKSWLITFTLRPRASHKVCKVTYSYRYEEIENL